MKAHLFFLLLIVCALACKAKNSTPNVEDDLKNAMQTYLYNAVNNDSSNVKYRVEKVIYYNDKDKYICEFTVNLKAKLFDTTGIMKANISKDFKTVNRTY